MLDLVCTNVVGRMRSNTICGMCLPLWEPHMLLNAIIVGLLHNTIWSVYKKILTSY